MRYLLIALLLAGFAGVPLRAQDAAKAKEDAQPEKKEAAKLNVYEATFTGMT